MLKFLHLLRRPGWVCALALAILPVARAADSNDLAWPPITSETKPWAWWWWHGSAVDETNVAHELQRFHDAGLGGVQVTTIYGVKGGEARDIPYLTPHWLDMMGYTVDAAKSRDMGVTMTLGSGWCFGGPTVSDEDANAKVALKIVKAEKGKPWFDEIDRDNAQAIVAVYADGKTEDLTWGMKCKNCDWAWSPPTNGCEIYVVSQKPSGQKVKRPAPGGEGWMLNPAYPQSVTNWLTWFDSALKNYSGSKPMAVFQDSYEYRTDWAPDFFPRFEKMRGYRLQDELPALFADTSSITNTDTLDHIGRVKYDYRRTIAETMAQESEPAWIEWAHKNGFTSIYQAHGTPTNWLDLYGDPDMPETEMFHNDRSILISKFASSAAHTQGHQFTGAETGTWMKEHFTETLGDVKGLADDMFLSGVNRIFYHGTCYSPDDAPWPGWLFYASTEMNPRNPIWHDVSTVNAYIARVQSVLQSGQPDNDVLLYWPVADFWSQPDGLMLPMTVSATDWFKNQPIGKMANDLWNEGYQFDYVSDAQLLTAKVVDGKIQMPGGSYQIIVVPECRCMPLETFKQLLTLAKNGAVVFFVTDFPMDVSGAIDLQNRRAEFKTVKSKLIPDWTVNHGMLYGYYPVGKGFACVVRSYPEDDVFNSKLACEICVKAGLSFTRRSFNGGWNYFIVNRSGTNFDDWITLGRPAQSVAFLDPMTSNSGVAAQNKNGQIHLQLAAGQSIILRAFANKKAEGTAWAYWQTNGQPVEITGNWHIKFLEGGPVLPADAQITRLASWTTLADTNCQAFAGTAKYELTFAVPRDTDFSSHFELSLGNVCQSARVKLNGKDYGTLIMSPFRVVVDNLKPAGNVLEVEVTSVAANRIRNLDQRGVNWKYFKDINIVNVDYKPFNAANWPLTDCGLLGPVTLTPVRASE